ncbi:hypothetical protein M1446_05395 [Candidatus Dependentiae bacterium]|nr:hypothetical protein [Candidatus Dependentiae bacterium]
MFSESFLFEHLQHYSKKIWYLITFFIVIFIFAVWFKFFFVSMNRVIRKHKENLMALVNQQNTVILKPSEAMPDREEIQTPINIDKNKFLKASQVTLFILENLKRKNLELKISDVSPEVLKNFYKKSIFDFEISGKFESVLDFLQSIRLSNYLIKIKKCKIKKNNEENISCFITLQALQILNSSNNSHPDFYNNTKSI